MSDQPKLGLTTGRQAVVSVLAGALFCGVLLAAFELTGNFPPVVPWSVPILFILLAVGVTVYSRMLPKRLEERKVSSQEAVAALVFGKSSIMTGALFAGAHVVYVMRYIQLFDAPLPSARVVQGAATIVTALLLAGAGALLERACVVHDNDDEDDSNGAKGHPEPA